MENLSPDIWLQKGLAGGCMFLLLVIIILVFRFITKQADMQAKQAELKAELDKLNLKKVNDNKSSVDKLCDKIDSLIEAFYASNKCISEMGLVTSNEYTSIKEDTKRGLEYDQKIYDAIINVQADVRTLLSKEGVKNE